MTGCTYSNDGDISGNHGVNDVWVVKLKEFGVGISEMIDIKDINVFPNPVSGDRVELSYYLTKSGGVSVVILDVEGNLVVCGDEVFEVAGEHSREVGLEGLTSGVYFLEVRSGDGVCRRELVRY